METANTKTTIFNLIILDESGSMHSLVNQTVSGCNETLNVIRSAQKKAGDKVRNLVSIYAFQANSEIPSRYIVKNAPIGEVKDITTEDYKPWGATPLFDAVGSTISELRVVAPTHEDAMAIITIITDGMENSSTHYTAQHVANIIDSVKELGWTVNFIGANIDASAEAAKIHIDNSLQWDATVKGTDNMYTGFSKQCDMALGAICEDLILPVEERVKRRKSRSNSFFK